MKTNYHQRYSPYTSAASVGAKEGESEKNEHGKAEKNLTTNFHESTWQLATKNINFIILFITNVQIYDAFLWIFSLVRNESSRFEWNVPPLTRWHISSLPAACLTPLGTNQNKPDILFWIIYCRIVSICYDDGRTDGRLVPRRADNGCVLFRCWLVGCICAIHFFTINQPSLHYALHTNDLWTS